MSSYDNFAKQYSVSMGDSGDFFHKNQIDPYVYKIIGNPKGKKIYDIGCGNGYMARKLSRKGGTVCASDSSDKLLKIAEEKSRGLSIKYFLHEATDFSNYKKDSFDIVLMNMVIHYIKDLDALFKGVSRVLRKNGVFVFSNEHMFRPAYPYSAWIMGKIHDKDKLFIKVTNYLKTYTSKVISGWDNSTELTIYNRPLNVFVNLMSRYGLYLFNMYEPESVGFAKDFSEKMQKSHHIPTFIVIGAIKK